MLRSLVLFYFLSIQLAVFSQNFSISNDWRESTLAFVGADNNLSCTVEGIACRYVILSTDNGTITKEQCNYYTFRPTRVADSKIIIGRKVGKKTKKIGGFYIRVRAMPDPVAIIGGLYSGSIAKGALKAQMGIGAGLPPNLSINIHYLVKSYSITIVRNRELFFFRSCDGNLFNEEIYNAFKELQKDDIVVFSSIMVQRPDEQHILAKPVELKIE